MRSDEFNCHGTEVTITPGMNSNRPLSRSALWLCSACSHQCAYATEDSASEANTGNAIGLGSSV